MNELTREEKIRKIQLIIWNKETNFWCKITPEWDECNCTILWEEYPDLYVLFDWQKKPQTIRYPWYMFVIWHPVMLWDVLDWRGNQPAENTIDCLPDILYRKYWKELRKPLQDQSDDCIDYIYGLLPPLTINREWNE